MSASLGFSGADVIGHKRRRVGVVGSRSRANLLATLVLSVLLSGGQAKAEWEVVVDTAANSTAYQVDYLDEAIVYTSDASATKVEIAAGLAAAWNANPVARGMASAVSDGVDTVTITGKWPGREFTVSDSDANLTTTQTVAAASASNCAVGVAVCATEWVVDAQRGGPYVKGAQAQSALFTAQVDTWTLVYDAAVDIVAEIEFLDGRRYVANHVQASDAATSVTALAAALNGILPAATVLASTDGDDLVLTAEVAGEEFTSKLSFRTVGAATVDTGVLTLSSNKDNTTSFHRAWQGISLLDGAVPVTEGGAPVWTGSQMVPCENRGTLWVAGTGTPSAGAQVFVELSTASSLNGRFYGAASASRIAVPTSRARFTGNYNATDGVVEIELL